MWKWWKKDKYVFKYVEFSDGTARKNPDMIIREYKRLLQSMYEKTQPLRAQEYRVIANVPYTPTSYYGSNKQVITVDAEEIISYHRQIQEQKARELDMMRIYKDMKHELNKFKEMYID